MATTAAGKLEQRSYRFSALTIDQIHELEQYLTERDGRRYTATDAIRYAVSLAFRTIPRVRRRD